MNHTDYYVYAHRDLNGIVFYVGKGRGKRAYAKHGRSELWKSVANNNYIVEIIKDNLTNSEALELERFYFNNPPLDWRLVNVFEPSTYKKCTVEDFADYFYYDESSPTFLRWKIDKLSRWGKVIAAKKDSIAGYIHKGRKEYANVKLHLKNYSVHRIIYALHYGEIPDNCVINHIDGNGLNNSIDNLELCTMAQNNRRTKAHRGDTRRCNNSGITGVHLFDHYGFKYWVASWRHEEYRGRKYFSIEKHGESEAFRLACEYRKQMIEKLNSEGAGYSVVE